MISNNNKLLGVVITVTWRKSKKKMAKTGIILLEMLVMELHVG
jgi:hypothetical protein